ncbi:MAG: hypothetical protein JXA58_04675, partial [Dehalococcoidia bacterium]|nr:hypothetical protein [Dehalococcoidia bacterium]
AAEMQLPLGSVTWESEALRLPADRPDSFYNAITGERLYVHGGALRLADTLATFPVALLVGTDADR